jgi:hypothetical protein
MRIGTGIAMAILLCAIPAHAAEIRTRGKLEIAPRTPLVAVSTDPVVQRVLNDDFFAAGRNTRSDASGGATITVTLSEQVLKPGVSLQQLAPGDPKIIALLRAAGATTPPIGDSGDKPIDPYANLERREMLNPDDPATRQLREEQAFYQSLARGPVNAQESDENQGYDKVVIARATVSDRGDEFIVVAVVHPDDEFRKVKKLVAEEIANAVLH